MRLRKTIDCFLKKCRIILPLSLLKFHTYFQDSVSEPKGYKLVNSSAALAFKFLLSGFLLLAEVLVVADTLLSWMCDVFLPTVNFLRGSYLFLYRSSPPKTFTCQAWPMVLCIGFSVHHLEGNLGSSANLTAPLSELAPVSCQQTLQKGQPCYLNQYLFRYLFRKYS